MSLTKLLLFLSISICSFSTVNTIKCGDNEIDNCKTCGSGNQSNSCGICDDEYFPLLENKYCIKCDDPLYGQVGCKGACDGSDYINTESVNCQQCKEGYYNDNGKCLECNDYSEGCIDCSFELNTETGKNEFKCKKCLNENEYKLNDNNCDKCALNLVGCKKCHFIGDQITEAECDECNDGYYKNSKKCEACKSEKITGGECTKCSPDSNPVHCECYARFALSDNYTCEECSENCNECEYNKETKSTKCIKCNQNYGINSLGQCVKCESGCFFCEFDESNKSKCLLCETGKLLTNDNQCLDPPSNCLEYEYDNIKKKIVCNGCDRRYILNIEDGSCLNCVNITEIGSGCGFYQYNPFNKKYECEYCSNISKYAYVNNTFQCLLNTDKTVIGLYGCKIAKYNISSGKYECLQCKNTFREKFLKVINDNSCIEYSSIKNLNCLEVEKIGDKNSCTKCDSSYALIENNPSQIKQCLGRNNKLSYCLQGKKESDSDEICTICDNNSKFENNICSCNSDSFSKNTNICYKCNDDKQGIPGCDISKGCEYSNNQLKCNQCEDGYISKTEGKCSLCSDDIPNCGKCHLNTENNEVICDSCVDSIYYLNTQDNKCQLNDCDEYPDISPGCIICKDKLNDYKTNKKCQTCKYGYFKTKDDKCIYCSSEQVGGLGCYKCGYEVNDEGIETDKIICKECFSIYSIDYTIIENYNGNIKYPNIDINSKSHLLSKDGKCFDCRIQFSESCTECKLIENENGNENIKCVSCIEGFYLTPEGNCVNISGLIPTIQNCRNYGFVSGDIRFKCYFNESENSLYLGLFDYSDYENTLKLIYDLGLKGFEKKCLYCKDNFFVNEKGECEQLNYDKCSFNSIVKNMDNLLEPCNTFCYSNYYSHNYYSNDIFKNVIIYLSLPQCNQLYIGNFGYNYENYIYYFFKSYNIKACLNNSGVGDENSPTNLKYCKDAYYYLENNTYICSSCYEGYKLNKSSNLCYSQYTIVNIGTELNPIYNYIDSDTGSLPFALVTNENGDKKYVSNSDLVGCAEADENTTYINSKYNCTKCSENYLLYYSKFYERVICQNIKDKIIEEYTDYYTNFYEYESIQDKFNTTNGICKKNYFFTPDKKNCYKCDDFPIEDEGCKRECSYSLKRNKIFKCEGKCKTGYIESSEGSCTTCNSYNSGCYECHYDSEYSNDYTDIKRKRRFVCDFCEDGYILSSSGECINCYSTISNCDKCEIDPNNKNNYICKKCEEGYFINDQGQCEICDESHFKGISQNKCFDCGDTTNGGIDKCLLCESNGEKAICQQCLPGYLLLTNNNSCIEIVKNKELEKFFNCEILSMEDNQLICSKCIKGYTLIKKNNIKQCIFIRTLYDPYFEIKNEMHFYFVNHGQKSYNDYLDFRKNDYIYQRYNKYYPCQEAENLGTEENPSYSCTKCYEELKIDKTNDYSYYPTKVTEVNSKLSYCIVLYTISVCTEATYRINNGIEEYNCTKCINNYYLTFNEYTGKYVCYNLNTSDRCSVHYCKKCNPNNNNFCKECYPNYELNNYTGSCVKKTHSIPAIIWRDIYSLVVDYRKIVDYTIIYKPFLKIRGFTSNQINMGHAFNIYLNFKKNKRIRNLAGEDEVIKMSTICEILDEVDEIIDDINMVEYICSGNLTEYINLSIYRLDNIEEGNNENLLQSTNLNELINNIKEKLGDLTKLNNITKSSFTYEDLFKIIIFQMDDKIENITTNNYKFNFKIEGKLNKNITNEEITINKEFEMSNIDNRANCIFTIKPDKIADLSCDLNVENHKDIKSFYFKTSQIFTDENEIYLSKFNNIELINSDNNNNNNSDNDDKDKLKLIIIICSCGVGGGVLIGIGIYCCVKKSKPKSNSKIKVGEVSDRNTMSSRNTNRLGEDKTSKSFNKIEIKNTKSKNTKSKNKKDKNKRKKKK